VRHVLIGLIMQQLYREILSVADENGGALDNRVIFFADELGTIPKIQSLEMMFSASRSRKISIVGIIQSMAQLQQHYGKEGAEIIVDNVQDTIFGGFAPGSETAEMMSKALGSRTVMSGLVNRGHDRGSEQLSMIERSLLTSDELKTLPKQTFVVMKTGTYPMRTRLRLYKDWGITFGAPYRPAEQAEREVSYAGRESIERAIALAYPQYIQPDETEEVSISVQEKAPPRKSKTFTEKKKQMANNE